MAAPLCYASDINLKIVTSVNAAKKNVVDVTTPKQLVALAAEPVGQIDAYRFNCAEFVHDWPALDVMKIAWDSSIYTINCKSAYLLVKASL